MFWPVTMSKSLLSGVSQLYCALRTQSRTPCSSTHTVAGLELWVSRWGCFSTVGMTKAVAFETASGTFHNRITSELHRRIPVAHQSAIARVTVSRDFNDRDGELLRVHVEFLMHDLSDALHGPAFLLDGAAFQHGDLYVRHRLSRLNPACRASLLRYFESREKITQLEARSVFGV